MNKILLINGLKRLGRTLLGASLGFGLDYAANALTGLQLPSAVAPFAPIVIGAVINGGAKILRDKFADDLHPICKVV